jgi:SAM-dependent methyltransferase
MTDTQAASGEPKLDHLSKENQAYWNSKENQWYLKDVGPHIQPNSRKLLEEYSHILPEDVDAHIYKMRDILWSHAPYPCVGQFKFLRLNLVNHPQYQHILSTLRSASGPCILDLGCCVAPDLRSLAHNGIPSTQLFGSDLNASFLTTSYDLFDDASAFKGTLVAADIFSSTLFEEQFLGWENKFSIIHAGLFLHLFNWERQLLVCEKIVKLLKDEKGSMLVGEMVGCQGGGLRGPASKNISEERKPFLHDDGSFAKLWGEVAKKTGTVGCWKVEGVFTLRYKEWEDGGNSKAFFEGEGIGWFTFSVERV